MKHGFVRVAAATPAIRLADCQYNAYKIRACMAEAAQHGCEVLTLPALCLTGSTCGDLLYQPQLIKNAEDALVWLQAESVHFPSLITFVGTPLVINGKLCNYAAAICNGVMHPANHIFRHKLNPHFAVAVEFGDELCAPVPPSCHHAMAGAMIIVNLSASHEEAGRAAHRRQMVLNQSSRLHCAYVYANAGDGESTTSYVFSGHHIIAENGQLLAESALFENGLTYADIDMGFLVYERLRSPHFQFSEESYTEMNFENLSPDVKLERDFPALPFVPEHYEPRCAAILNMQVAGLSQRLRHTGFDKVTLALSGGLDSTLALLVAVKTFDRLKLDRKGIHAISMPGFGSSSRTKENAKKLAEALNVTYREIPITDAVLQHFNDIGHPPDQKDLLYENAQARERTQIAMDIAAQLGGLMLGTGGMSEMALGFTTFNGDHMSMYNVNASMPKTLVRPMLKTIIKSIPEAEAVLNDIIATPISPELLPPDENGNVQETEKIVGPYELHDFFLYHMIRRGAEPEKVIYLAVHVFNKTYDEETIRKWYGIFIRRFFAGQFKRACMPDGVRIGSVSLSAKAGWQMPSDVSFDGLYNF